MADEEEVEVRTPMSHIIKSMNIKFEGLIVTESKQASRGTIRIRKMGYFHRQLAGVNRDAMKESSLTESARVLHGGVSIPVRIELEFGLAENDVVMNPEDTELLGVGTGSIVTIQIGEGTDSHSPTTSDLERARRSATVKEEFREGYRYSTETAMIRTSLGLSDHVERVVTEAEARENPVYDKLMKYALAQSRPDQRQYAQPMLGASSQVSWTRWIILVVLASLVVLLILVLTT
jgi:hypothetical protein